jgi:deoxycytidylate deaminase
MNSEDRFMMQALVSSFESDDPNRQYGAVLVDKSVVVGSGCNTPIKFTYNSKFDWSVADVYEYVVHAEEVAIDSCLKLDYSGSAIYTIAEPHPKAILYMIRKGIKRCTYGPVSPLYQNKRTKKQIQEIISKAGYNFTFESYKGSFYKFYDKLKVFRLNCPEAFD